MAILCTESISISLSQAGDNYNRFPGPLTAVLTMAIKMILPAGVTQYKHSAEPQSQITPQMEHGQIPAFISLLLKYSDSSLTPFNSIPAGSMGWFTDIFPLVLLVAMIW